MKKYGLLILAMVSLAVGCKHQPIDKQEADAIVTQYIKKNFKADDNTERAVYYYNNFEEKWIEISFWDDEDEDIIAENAFVYYIDEDFDMGYRFPHPYRIILVQKENGKYTVSVRSTRPYVKSDNYWNWTWLYSFVNGQFRN